MLPSPRALVASLAVASVVACSSASTTSPADGGAGGSSGRGGGGGAGSGGGGDGAGSGGGGAPVAIGDTHAGTYNLGPVAFHGADWNSCAPYTPDLEAQAGDKLAGVGVTFNGDGQLCDGCIQITTRLGKSVVAKVVTTGQTKGPNDVDLSQAAYDAIYELDPQGTSDDPRPMTWQIVKCPMPGNLEYQFQTQANVDWTSLWVRNQKLPVTKLEVKSAKHADWFALRRGGDGTFTDDGGFGSGSFTLRVTSIDGQQVTDTLPGFTAGAVVAGAAQFQ